MKKQIFLSICLLITILVAAQQTPKDKIIYLDSLERVANEDNYQILRVMKDYYTDARECLLYDYYKSGKKKLIGKFKDKYDLLKSGEFVEFYENGNKASVIHFEDNLPVGKFYLWYEKGNIKSEGEFLQFKNSKKPVLKVNQFWSKIGIQRVTNGNGHYEDDDTTWYSEGELKNGFQEGDWTGVDVVDYTTFVEKYKEGVLVSGVSTDSLKKTYKYHEIEVRATPNQNKNEIYRYLKNNIRVPAYIQQNKLNGRVEISFTVNKDGWITKTKVIRSMGYGMDEELIRVIRNWDQWNPAKRRGVPYESQLTIPFSIYNGKL